MLCVSGYGAKNICAEQLEAILNVTSYHRTFSDKLANRTTSDLQLRLEVYMHLGYLHLLLNKVFHNSPQHKISICVQASTSWQSIYMLHLMCFFYFGKQHDTGSEGRL